MTSAVDFPVVVFAASLLVQWVAALLGAYARSRRRPLDADTLADLGTVRAATLTLLALIIGFSFSMAVSRYDQRKTYEEAEANAISTEFVRGDLLAQEDANRIHALLIRYLDLRISFYETRDAGKLSRIGADTDKLQNELWDIVLGAASRQATPIVALAVAGMNDVLNSQSYTQAAWWNRIPVGAWAMMGFIAIAANLLLGYGEHRKSVLLLLILPVIVSSAFLLVADIDSPRGGIIRVLPQNLIATAQSLKARPG
jgi:hypothetical protein